MLLSVICILICASQSDSNASDHAEESNLHTETFEEKAEVRFENFAVQIAWSELNKKSESKLRATVEEFLRHTIPYLQRQNTRNSKTGGGDTRNNGDSQQSKADKQVGNTKPKDTSVDNEEGLESTSDEAEKPTELVQEHGEGTDSTQALADTKQKAHKDPKKETKSKKGLSGLYANLKSRYGTSAKKTVSKIVDTTTKIVRAYPPLFLAGSLSKPRKAHPKTTKEDLFAAKEVVVFLLYSSSEVSGTNAATPLSDAVIYDVSIQDVDGELASLRYNKLPHIHDKQVFIEDDSMQATINRESTGGAANLYRIVINKRLRGVLLTLYKESKKEGLKVEAQVTYQAQHGKQEEKTYKEDITEVESKSLDEFMKHKLQVFV